MQVNNLNEVLNPKFNDNDLYNSTFFLLIIHTMFSKFWIFVTIKFIYYRPNYLMLQFIYLIVGLCYQQAFVNYYFGNSELYDVLRLIFNGWIFETETDLLVENKTWNFDDNFKSNISSKKKLYNKYELKLYQ